MHKQIHISSLTRSILDGMPAEIDKIKLNKQKENMAIWRYYSDKQVTALRQERGKV